MYCPFRHLNDGNFGICYGSSCMAYRQWDNNLAILNGYNPDIQCYCTLMVTPPTINYNGACI